MTTRTSPQGVRPPCRLCFTADPTKFYETQSHRLCRLCFTKTYYEPGKQRLLQSKLDRGECVDCGLRVTLHNSSVFDYDHRDPTTKHKEVSRLCYAPLAVFQDELAKCDLVCANDHRLRTQARGYSRKGGRPRAGLKTEQTSCLKDKDNDACEGFGGQAGSACCRPEHH